MSRLHYCFYFDYDYHYYYYHYYSYYTVRSIHYSRIQVVTKSWSAPFGGK